jgi:hypothetical protein
MDLRSKLLSIALKPLLNSAVLKGIGTVSSLEVDTTGQTINATVELAGEIQPVEISANYAFHEGPKNQLYLQLNAIKASRSWISAAAEKYFIGEIDCRQLPQGIISALKVAGVIKIR